MVARTSMNLNENPRLETLEISTDPAFGEFMIRVVDDIFRVVPPDSPHSDMPEFADTPAQFQLIDAPILELDALKIPRLRMLPDS